MRSVGLIAAGWRGVLLASMFTLAACSDPGGRGASTSGEQDDAAAGEAADQSPSPVGEAPGGGGADSPLQAETTSVETQQAAEGAETANNDSDVDLAIDTVLGGDHKDYRDVISRVQKAVADGDKESFAALVSYPIEVKVGKPRTIANPSELVAAWDSIVTPDIAQIITTQKYSDLFVNWQGVMFGDGQLWINGICRDDACTNSDILVTAIQSNSP